MGASVNELDFIDALREALSPPSPAGIGDDGACVDLRDAVVCTDTMVEGVHFDRSYSSWADVAWKLLASNISDCLAMGGEPVSWLLNCALAGTPEVRGDTGLIAGFRACADAWTGGALPLIGGDTARASCNVLSVTVLGRLQGPVLTRSGAVIGDRIWLDGDVGLAAAGLAALREAQAGPAWERAVQAHRRPAPPRARANPASVHAAIDVSDGLAIDLMRVATASRVGIELHGEIPGNAYLRGLDPDRVDEWQLRGGDDYVRVLVSPEAPGAHCTAIGHVTGGPPRVQRRHGSGVVPVDTGGWVHQLDRD